MAKFIDSNKRYSIYEDEIVTRCNCGGEMLSFGLQSHKTSDNDNYIALALLYYTIPMFKARKKDENAYMMVFPSVDAISLFYDLLTGKINEGNGAVLSFNGGILGIQRDIDDKNKVVGVSFVGFPSERKFLRYNKCRDVSKISKYSSWQISLDLDEFSKFVKEIEKILIKYIPEFKDKGKEN